MKRHDFTYPRSGYDETQLNKELIYKLILRHYQESAHLKKLKSYYLGEHVIENQNRREGLPNNKTVANHAKDIADTATGYFMGNPVTYTNTANADLERLLVEFDKAEVDETDSDNALSMAIYGCAYEYVYAIEDKVELNVVSLDPEHTFMVYDDSVEKQALFAVYYYKIHDDVKDTDSYRAIVLTETLKYDIEFQSASTYRSAIEAEPHKLGDIPIIEYQNNRYQVGDYEQQISLIDAYNTLMSSRVNDKEQAINSILLIYGASLADDPDEAKQAMAILREEGLLELPSDAKAEFLKNSLDEQSVEVLRKAIKEDIYTFSHVPNITDENFAGNSSGVAMEFKLLGLEMITKTKQRYYVKGLRKRIKLFAEYFNLTDIEREASSIIPQFSRGLPKNLLEISQVISNLTGKVSARQLISLLPFVEDPDAELEALEEEKEQADKEPAFSQNASFDEVVDEQEEG